jgi:hypothetical protein
VPNTDVSAMLTPFHLYQGRLLPLAEGTEEQAAAEQQRAAAVACAAQRAQEEAAAAERQRVAEAEAAAAAAADRERQRAAATAAEEARMREQERREVAAIPSVSLTVRGGVRRKGHFGAPLPVFPSARHPTLALGQVRGRDPGPGWGSGWSGKVQLHTEGGNVQGGGGGHSQDSAPTPPTLRTT